MIRTQSPLILIMLLLLITACGDGKDPEQQDLEVQTEVELIMNAQIALHDLEGLILNQIYLIENNDLTGEVSTHPIDFNYFSSIGSCANWLLDKDANVLVVDFGSGCEDLIGSVRSGKLTISYINGQNPIGNEISIALENFQLENLEFTGALKLTKTIDNPAQYESGYSIELSNFSITRSSETVSFEGQRQILYFDRTRGDGTIANRPADFYANNNIRGTVSNVNFELNTTVSLAYASECWFAGKKFPAAGLETLSFEETIFELDYSPKNPADESCNYSFSLSQNELSWEFNLED